MKDLFRKNGSLQAKLVTLKAGGSSPLFMKTMISAMTSKGMTFKGIPVIPLEGYTMYADITVGEFFLEGEIVHPKDTRVIQDIIDAVLKVPLDAYPKAQFGFIIVTDSDEFGLTNLDAIKDVIEFTKITKFKTKWNHIKIEGLTDAVIARNKSFVVDTEVTD